MIRRPSPGAWSRAWRRCAPSAASAGYFEHIRHFIEGTLGRAAVERLEVIIDDPGAVAHELIYDVGSLMIMRSRTTTIYVSQLSFYFTSF